MIQPAKIRLISQIYVFAFLLFRYEKLRIVFMARNHRAKLALPNVNDMHHVITRAPATCSEFIDIRATWLTVTGGLCVHRCVPRR